jgi:hypothetical protein
MENKVILFYKKVSLCYYTYTMIITHFGRQHFKLTVGDLVVAVNPVSKEGKGKVDHIKPLSKGGAPRDKSNLRVVPASQNESFSRNKDGSLKSQTSKRERKRK